MEPFKHVEVVVHCEKQVNGQKDVYPVLVLTLHDGTVIKRNGTFYNVHYVKIRYGRRVYRLAHNDHLDKWYVTTKRGKNEQ